MAKLSKLAWRDHEEANRILTKDRLTDDEREFVLDHWTPLATNRTDVAGIYFTPVNMAQEMAVFMPDWGRIVDLCAGIGRLSWALCQHTRFYSKIKEIVAVEINHEFVEIGRKILPDVRWVQGNVFDQGLWHDLGAFNYAIGNPPFGRVKTRNETDWLRYQGDADLMTAEVAMRITDAGATLILPQMNCPFEYSGQRHYEQKKRSLLSQAWRGLHAMLPGLTLNPCFDTTTYGDFDGAKGIKVEVVDVTMEDDLHAWDTLRAETFTFQPTLL